MKPEQVEFFSDNERVSGWFFAASSYPGPAVVFCPGFTGTKFAKFYEPYVEFFVNAGISVLMFDYRGWGESEGHRGQISPLKQVEDVRNALSYLETRDEVDQGRRCLLGFSFGGGVAAYTAAVDSRVRCCVSISPVVDGEDWLRGMRSADEWEALLVRLSENRLRRVVGEPEAFVSNTKEIMISGEERARAVGIKGEIPAALVPTESPLKSAEEIIEFAPLSRAREASEGGLLLFAVEDDQIVPAEHARKLAAASSGSAELILLSGGGHYDAYLRHFDTISSEILKFLRNRLGLPAVDNESEATCTS
ncbi:MAG TPA: alpha/beta fold hydrolase [Terrimesophilobacter sp.]|nr:alpha/beta fold hydrolase [Terrimesophilobacter sp.]HRP99028.1 alpha/beta fold hydrolase [Terrimesophilobacter sp.]